MPPYQPLPHPKTVNIKALQEFGNTLIDITVKDTSKTWKPREVLVIYNCSSSRYTVTQHTAT